MVDGDGYVLVEWDRDAERPRGFMNRHTMAARGRQSHLCHVGTAGNGVCLKRWREVDPANGRMATAERLHAGRGAQISHGG